MHLLRWAALIVGLNLVGSSLFAQIDPEKRQLVEFGYNHALNGNGPISGYLFYFRNDPSFLDNTNMALRLAIAPVWVDSELGFRHALGENTDFAIGAAGGAFGDSYSEIRQGSIRRSESFLGHGGEVSASVYHLFNPADKIPLYGITRLSTHYTTYEGDSDTSNAFTVPEDHGMMNLRLGLRFGGTEPTMLPDLAMELSTWFETQARTGPDRYGFSGDRRVEDTSQLFWARGLLNYKLPWEHHFSVNLTAGTSIHTDRLNAYRLGGFLPLSSEFPLFLPGYYYQEITAKQFALLSSSYTVPLDSKNRWNLTALGAVAGVDYLRGLEQPGHVHSGVGVGVGYRSPSDMWHVVLGYAYGVQAIRDGNRGAHSVGILVQLDLEAKHRGRERYIDIENPYKSRGLFRLFQD